MAKKSEPKSIHSSDPTVKIGLLHGGETIGGTQIGIFPPVGQGILLDFGYDFTIANDYLAEFLRVREIQLLSDGLELNLIPKPIGRLRGLYRTDYYDSSPGISILKSLIEQKQDEIDNIHTNGVGPKVRKTPEVVIAELQAELEDHQRRIQELEILEKKRADVESQFGIDLHSIFESPISHVLISHAHTDHIGFIRMLNPSIQCVMGKNTHSLLSFFKEMFDPKTNFTGILDYTPFFQISEKGGRKKSADSSPRSLVILEKREEWVKLGEKSPFQIQFYETYHSLPGAGAYLIKIQLDSGIIKKVIYTGDFRMHPNTEVFIENARRFEPDLLIIEGTQLGRDETDYFPSENAVKARLTEICKEIALKSPESITFFDCGSRDLWRFESFYHAAVKNNKTLIIDPKTFAYLQMCVKTKISNLTEAELGQIKIYLPQLGWGIYSEEDYSNSDGAKMVFQKDKNWNLDDPRIIKAEQIRSNPGKYVMYLPFYSLNLLLDLHPFAEAFYIQSTSDPFDQEGEIKEEKRQNWLQRFGIKPENKYKAHCSGHAFMKELAYTIESIKPKYVLPIHTTQPETFKKLGISPTIHILDASEAKKDELGLWYDI